MSPIPATDVAATTPIAALEPDTGAGSSRMAYYKAWDKFDADAALEKVEQEPLLDDRKAGKPITKETATVKKLSKMAYSIASENKPDPAAANIEKEKGNDLFKKGQFAAAVVHYSESIKLDPTNPVLPINRAMALLKLQRFAEAEQDCTLGLKMDGKNVKALWRRGIAQRSLGRVEQARKDFEHALSLDPNNKAVKDELSKLQSTTVILPKPEKAIPDITAGIKKPEAPAAPISSPAKKLAVQDDLMVVPQSSIPKGHNSPAKEFSSKRVMIKEVSGADESKLFSRPAGKNPDVQTIADTETQKTAKHAASMAKTAPTPLSPPASVPTALTPATSASTPRIAMVAPTTTLEFQRDWKSYSKKSVLLYQYFKLIPAAALPNLFKSAFESDYLSSMLQVFQEHYIPSEEPQELYLMLFHLAKVQRFDMTLMFMSGTDKKDLLAIFQYLHAQLSTQTLYTEQDLRSLASKFNTKF
ncbi:RNA polymerase II-associated protein 3 [Podila humilis]|nr:RNA polymerase II-associated protein 3 [Podila humilis]